MTEISVQIDPKQWVRANSEEDNASTFVIPSMNQALFYIFALLNYRKLPESQSLGWGEVWKILFVMLNRCPEKKNNILPFLFVTRLSFETITEVVHGNRPDRFDETTYAPRVDRNALHYLFQLARKIDREPEKYMFGFVYSTSEACFLPLCATYCGMLRNAKFDETLEELASQINVPEQCLSSTQPLKEVQQKDGIVIIGLLRVRLALAKQIAEQLAKGVRGRLLIQMHNNGAMGAFQPLDASLVEYLQKHTNSLDHTLEWINTCDLTHQMVVTIKEDFSPNSPQRSYLMMQPWKVDVKFWVKEETHSGCKESCCK